MGKVSIMSCIQYNCISYGFLQITEVEKVSDVIPEDMNGKLDPSKKPEDIPLKARGYLNMESHDDDVRNIINVNVARGELGLF